MPIFDFPRPECAALMKSMCLDDEQSFAGGNTFLSPPTGCSCDAYKNAAENYFPTESTNCTFDKSAQFWSRSAISSSTGNQISRSVLCFEPAWLLRSEEDHQKYVGVWKRQRILRYRRSMHNTSKISKHTM